MSLTWTVFEILGTVAFAFSGATVGLARGMDVFGIALLSVVTAVGGGILRDVLAGIFPPFALRGPDGIVLALVTAAAVCIVSGISGDPVGDGNLSFLLIAFPIRQGLPLSR